jgi:hypothetical protein
MELSILTKFAIPSSTYALAKLANLPRSIGQRCVSIPLASNNCLRSLEQASRSRAYLRKKLSTKVTLKPYQ